RSLPAFQVANVPGEGVRQLVREAAAGCAIRLKCQPVVLMPCSIGAVRQTAGYVRIRHSLVYISSRVRRRLIDVIRIHALARVRSYVRDAEPRIPLLMLH